MPTATCAGRDWCLMGAADMLDSVAYHCDNASCRCMRQGGVRRWGQQFSIQISNTDHEQLDVAHAQHGQDGRCCTCNYRSRNPGLWLWCGRQELTVPLIYNKFFCRRLWYDRGDHHEVLLRLVSDQTARMCACPFGLYNPPPLPGRAQHGGGQKKCEGKVGAPGCRPDPRPGPQPRQPAASGRGSASAASRGARCGPPPPPPPPAPGCSSEWALRLRGQPLPSPGCRTPRRKEPRTQCRGAVRPPQGTDRSWGTCSIVWTFLGPSCGPLEPGDTVMSRHLRRTMLRTTRPKFKHADDKLADNVLAVSELHPGRESLSPT